MIACQKQAIEPNHEVLQQDLNKVSCDLKIPASSLRYNVYNGPVGKVKNKPNRNYPVLYIDYDGFTTDNWSWTSTPTELEGAGMSTEALQAVYDSVAKFFEPYRVYITTDESIYNKAKPENRQRVVLTNTNKILQGYTGVAGLGTYGLQSEVVCFVFSHQLGYIPKFVAVAIAHELGHTLSLRHQSLWSGDQLMLTYNPGNNYEAPIMGMAYYANSALWWKGYNDLHNWQDDDQILKTVLSK